MRQPGYRRQLQQNKHIAMQSSRGFSRRGIENKEQVVRSKRSRPRRRSSTKAPVSCKLKYSLLFVLWPAGLPACWLARSQRSLLTGENCWLDEFNSSRPIPKKRGWPQKKSNIRSRRHYFKTSTLGVVARREGVLVSRESFNNFWWEKKLCRKETCVVSPQQGPTISEPSPEHQLRIRAHENTTTNSPKDADTFDLACFHVLF